MTFIRLARLRIAIATIAFTSSRGELLATGARPRRVALTGVAALTPAELRTARMAARGMSNRDIAQALFVSIKAVEGQLSQSYAKLGIGGPGKLQSALGMVDERDPTKPFQ